MRTTRAPVAYGPAALLMVWTAGLLSGAGCIERTVTITTVPEGATVHLNDQEVGKSPITLPFTWYGDYDVICRKEGYETLRTRMRLATPWYQLPGIDLITECFVPFTVRDRRAAEFQLDPKTIPSREEILTHAEELKQRALFESD